MALVKYTFKLNSIFCSNISALFYKRSSPSFQLQRDYRKGCRSVHTTSLSTHRRINVQQKLSPQEVSNILRRNEKSTVFSSEMSPDLNKSISTPLNSVYAVDSNQLGANTPIEDKMSYARCVFTTGLLFGVFDGHGGPECSQVISKRLFEYIAACLLPRSQLRDVVLSFEEGKKIDLINNFTDCDDFIPLLQEVYDQSLHSWCKYLLDSGCQEFSMDEAMIGAFTRLDSDLSSELQNNKGSSIDNLLSRVATAGSVACVAHIDGPHLHIANTGDCGAVLGIQTEDSRGIDWKFERLSKNHDWANPTEIKRILGEHPKSETDYLIQDQRLLGVLMPFRAFGDVKFKSYFNISNEQIPPFVGPANVVENCHTPPYLTAIPEMTYRLLKPEDKFVILGTDGLWEDMSVVDVVTLVGEHAFGRQSLQPVRLPRRKVTLGELSKLLDVRQKQLKVKPVDENAATHLIRHSIGGSESGVDHHRICHSLTLPSHLTRYFRDDISIFVISLNSDFLKICPVEL